MNVAVFGASSQIAKDLVIQLSQYDYFNLTLFGRDLSRINQFLSIYCEKIKAHVKGYDSFHNALEFDVIVNFVGAGNPTRVKSLGQEIMSITEEFDDKALSYIKERPKCKYIFLSSGAVFGSDFSKPVSGESKAVFDINNLTLNSWYSIAKFYAEAKHRAMGDYNIIDIRVFSYISTFQDTKSQFLMSEILQSILLNKTLVTSSENIVRDFITPVDFFQLFEKIISMESCNLAIDAYTREPIDKMSLLAEMKLRYGLEYELVEGRVRAGTSGEKNNYYSVNRAAKTIGYSPRFSSLGGIINQFDTLLHN